MISCTQAWIIIGAGILAAFAVNAYFMVLFLEFVATVAKLQKREDEHADYLHGDDGGFNAFEQEQFWNLRKGEYRDLNNPALTALGDRLQPLQMLSFASAAAVIVIAGPLHWFVCG